MARLGGNNAVDEVDRCPDTRKYLFCDDKTDRSRRCNGLRFLLVQRPSSVLGRAQNLLERSGPQCGACRDLP
ncbi:hypothetical protein JZ751_009171 [Albula glossodonta]|uniref:Uncharacterized protein n=1 Tax=Albula glossodonta TaxID=121402 RepID=A0A8T2N0Q8_9TELE|nr:hypothetical protein JZ751_009171 [Albula glossodonta]